TRGGHTSLWHPLGRRTALSSDLSYAGSSGEFLFFNDHATPQYTNDDSFDYRQNNAYNRGLGRLRVDHRRGPWRLMSQGFALYKHQGIAGVAGAPSPGSTLTTGLGKLMIAATRRRLTARPGGHLRWLASAGHTGRTFVEASNSGAPRQHTRVVDTFFSPQLRLPLWRGAFTTLVADQRSEWIRVQTKSGDPARVLGAQDRARHRFGVGLEVEQFMLNNRLRVVPAIRVEALRSRFPAGDAPDQLATTDRIRSDVAASPRIGVRLRLAPGLDLRSSVGRYFRPPTVLELFGDRGAIRGNEELLPEQGTAIDGGLTLDRALGTRHHVYSQLAGFHRSGRDTIAMLPTGTAVRAFNLAGTRVLGLEAAISLALWSRHVELAANYTLMPTRNLEAGASGGSRPLPGRPLHQLFVR
ncbi:MAG: TonB-dependent receptor plug domain-containing protein, partial [Nannocystaceae bacterium]